MNRNISDNFKSDNQFIGRILVVLPCLNVGGTEIQTLNLCKALRLSGFDVKVCVLFEQDDVMMEQYCQAGIFICRKAATTRRPLSPISRFMHIIRTLLRLVKELHPDIIHIQYMTPGASTVIASALTGHKRILATVHTMADVYRFESLAVMRLLSCLILRSTICVSQAAEKSFFSSARNYDSSVRFKSHGNHFTIHNCLPYSMRCLDSIECDGKSVVKIGFIGRFEGIKGIDALLSVLTANCLLKLDLEIHLAGHGSLYSDTIERLYAIWGSKLHSEGKLTREEVLGFYDKIDILLMPSNSEAFGLTALEGMSRGCVVVASKVGGLVELLENGNAGVLIEDYREMAHAVKLLVEDKSLLIEKKKYALSRAREFSFEKYKDSICSLHKSLMSC